MGQFPPLPSGCHLRKGPDQPDSGHQLAESLVVRATLTWIILARLGLTWISLIWVALIWIALARIALARIPLSGIALSGIALTWIALARIALTASRVVTHRYVLPFLKGDGAGGAESKDQLVEDASFPDGRVPGPISSCGSPSRSIILAD